jgi:hypothetical protein
LICISRAARACLASRQTTSSPRLRSSCTSHGVIAPVSIPMWVSLPECRRTKVLICSGFVGHWPRHSLRPASLTTQIAVIFCETSKPTKRVINEPPMVRITEQRRPDRGTIGRSSANRDYRMSTYDKAITNAARALERAGVIARGRRQVTILNRQGLVEASCECYQLVRSRITFHLPKTYA